MPQYRVSEAARLLGVSDDTVRRTIESGKLPVDLDADGRQVIAGAALAQFSVEQANALTPNATVAESARNRMTGLITRVVKDGVMAQVEIQAGPFRIVSLISAEAATELALEPGVIAVASVKATNVVIGVVDKPTQS